MASKFLKGVQGSAVPETNILKLAGLWVKGDELTYADTGANTVFTHPANVDLLGLMVSVSTAFNGGPNITFGDGTTANLYGQVIGSLKNARSVYIPLGYNLTAAGSIVATVTAGGASAGALNVWAHYRPNSNEQKYVT